MPPFAWRAPKHSCCAGARRDEQQQLCQCAAHCAAGGPRKRGRGVARLVSLAGLLSSVLPGLGFSSCCIYCYPQPGEGMRNAERPGWECNPANGLSITQPEHLLRQVQLWRLLLVAVHPGFCSSACLRRACGVVAPPAGCTYCRRSIDHAGPVLTCTAAQACVGICCMWPRLCRAMHRCRAINDGPARQY